MLAKQIAETPWKKAALISLIILILITAFWFIPYDLGDDWAMYQGAVFHALQGQSLYANPVNQDYYYSNPPWVVALLLPLGLLPAKIGWAILSCQTLFALLILARRYNLSPFNLGLLILSPPVIYTILHGQIDVLVLAAFLLPSEWRPIIAITKPQVGLGLLFGTDLHKWKRTLLISGGILAASLVIFGNWPIQLIKQPLPYINSAHNYFYGIWPLFVPLAVGMVLVGMQKKDLRFFMAASPFFSPYAAVSSLVGIWFAACSALKSWQVAIILVSWWGASLYRLIA